MEIKECPQCGAPTKPSDKKCNYCKAEFFVSNIAYLANFASGGLEKYLKHYRDITVKDPGNPEGLLGLGLCYLCKGLYPLAQSCFQKIIENSPEMPQGYYYLALTLIKGRRIKTITLNETRQIESYLSLAIQLGGNPEYKLLLAMMKRDYYEMNGLKVPPPGAYELLNEIYGFEISKNEYEQLVKSAIVGEPNYFFGKVVIV